MEISITIPDRIAEQLREQWRDLPRHALEVLAADAYRHGLITSAQVQRWLELPSRHDVDAFLKRAGVFLHYTVEDLAEDARTLDELLGE